MFRGFGHLGRFRFNPVAIAFAALTVLAGVVLHDSSVSPVLAQPPAPSQLSVYSPQTTYTISVLQFGAQSYLGLVDLLEPLGSLDARADRKKYKLRFTAPGARTRESELQDGKPEGKAGGEKVRLSAPFVLQNGRGYIPLANVPEFLSRMGLQPVDLRAYAGRLFIGNVAELFSLDLKRGDPSRLVISFPAPVNPAISTGPSDIKLTFKREPVAGSKDKVVSWDDPLIKAWDFRERNGIAEIDVMGAAPLVANVADGGKTIIITASPGAQIARVPVPAPQTSVLTPPQNVPLPPPQRPKFLVLIDPAHGGNEIGAAITPQLPEKDVVMALARRVQRELGSRGIAASLLRNGDYAIGLDQRAVSANAARPALYISLHAANTGRGVRVYTELLGQESLSPRDFLPWDTAQSAFADLSGTVAGSVSAELESRKLPNQTLAAPLRPMNNIAAPAVAVEIAPPAAEVAQIASPAYLEQVAQSIAAGVAAVRSKLPEVTR